MKGRIRNTLLPAVLLAGRVLAADEQPVPTGREIMEERRRRHEAAAEYSDAVMTLEDASGAAEQRRLRMYEKRMADGCRRSLTVFLAPADIRGTGLLIWEREDGEDDQWLYLPSQRRLQRVAAGSKSSYFMGSDFTFEDLETEDLARHDYRRLESSGNGTNTCFVVEAIPREGPRHRGGYGRRVLWIRQDLFLPIRIDYFDRRGRLVKTWEARNVVCVRGEAWRPSLSVMDHRLRKHRTVMLVENMNLEADIPDLVFTDRYLLSERHLR